MIDRNLYKLMSNRYGNAWTDVAMDRRCPGSRFMNEFERHKRDFGSMNEARDMTLRLRLKGIDEAHPKCVQYDPEEGEITLTR